MMQPMPSPTTSIHPDSTAVLVVTWMWVSSQNPAISSVAPMIGKTL